MGKTRRFDRDFDNPNRWGRQRKQKNKKTRKTFGTGSYDDVGDFSFMFGDDLDIDDDLDFEKIKRKK